MDFNFAASGVTNAIELRIEDVPDVEFFEARITGPSNYGMENIQTKKYTITFIWPAFSSRPSPR